MVCGLNLPWLFQLIPTTSIDSLTPNVFGSSPTFSISPIVLCNLHSASLLPRPRHRKQIWHSSSEIVWPRHSRDLRGPGLIPTEWLNHIHQFFSILIRSLRILGPVTEWLRARIWAIRLWLITFYVLTLWTLRIWECKCGLCSDPVPTGVLAFDHPPGPQV